MTDIARPSQWKSRLILLLIVAMFFSSFFVAWGLRFAGWTPKGSKNLGELIQPPIDLTASSFRHADGKPYAWEPEKHFWRVVIVTAPDCTTACTAMTDTLFRVWETQGRQAERVDVLWFGELPKDARTFRKLFAMQASPELIAALPQKATATALPVYIMDNRGNVVMQYRPGFNPSDLRKDLARLLK
ncbi:MAG: hypothetical protein ACRERV_02530 [Methylococcales bacterium]